MRTKPSKKLCLFMILILLFMWSGFVQYPSFAQGRVESEVDKSGKLGKLLQALEMAYDELPRYTFDPYAVIENVGDDPIKLFEWVRDKTYFVPYRGSLRGTIGVLMDGLGNSLDRALLLHELLQISGHEARLAFGTLTREKAKDVWENNQNITGEDRLKTLPDYLQTSDKQIEDFIREYPLDREEVREVFERQWQEQERMQKEVFKRVKDQTSIIMASVEKFKAKKTINEEERVVDVLRDHWWVQWKKDESWINLDPTLRNTNSGEVLAEFKNTSDVEDLDEDMFHQVTLRVIIERWEEGNLVKECVLEHKLQPSKFFGERITMYHLPMNMSEDFNLFEADEPFQRLKATVLEQNEWLPVLNIGSQQITACSFYDSGVINDNPGEKPQAGGVRRVTGGLFNALAGGEKEEKDSKLTAEWIEYEIHIPDEDSINIQRQIFDLIGPALRLQNNIDELELHEMQRLQRGLAFLGEIEILLQVCQLSPEFFAHLIAENLLANRDILLEWSKRGEMMTGKDLVERTQEINPLPGLEYSLALARWEWSRFHTNLYLDRPNIICYQRTINLDRKGELIALHGFDIVHNDMAVLPSSDIDPFGIRLEQGVLETNAESFIIGSPQELTKDTAGLFAKSIAAGIEWLAIKDNQDPAWQKVRLPEDVRVRIEEELTAGYTVMIPEKPISIEGEIYVSWWRINNRTGVTLGVTDSGKGQAMTNYKILLLKHAAATCMIFAVVYFGTGHPPGEIAAACLLGAALGALSGAVWLPGLSRIFRIIVIALIVSKVYFGS